MIAPKFCRKCGRPPLVMKVTTFNEERHKWAIACCGERSSAASKETAVDVWNGQGETHTGPLRRDAVFIDAVATAGCRATVETLA